MFTQDKSPANVDKRRLELSGENCGFHNPSALETSFEAPVARSKYKNLIRFIVVCNRFSIRREFNNIGITGQINILLLLLLSFCSISNLGPSVQPILPSALAAG